MRRFAFAGAVTLAAGLALSPTAVADPTRAQVPPAAAVATAIPNPERDPVPPRPLCSFLEEITFWGACSLKCDGINDSYRIVTPVPQACDEMGRVYRAGLHFRPNPQSPPNFAEAFRFFGLACTPAKPVPGIEPAQPYWAGCFDLATAYLKGEGTAKDEAAARRLYAQACGLAVPTVTYTACFALGELLEAGTGGAKDLGAALDAYKKACGASYPRACRAALRIEPATRAPSHPAPGTPTSLPVPHRPPPRGVPVR